MNQQMNQLFLPTFPKKALSLQKKLKILMNMRKFYLLTLLAFLPLLANADAVEIDGIYYNLNEETHKAEVTSNPNKYSGEVTVPASITYNATVYSVTAIGEWAFMDCEDLHKVNIPSTVSVIGSCAFWGCSSLEEITLPEGLTAIECSTFEGCSSLKNVIIPSTVTRIGNNPGEPSDGPFSGCPLETLFVPASVQTIGGGGLWATPNTIIIMESATPPSSIDIYALEDALGGQIFSKIIVPDGSKSAYQNANVWNKYSDDILEMSESSVRIFKGVEAGTLSTLISESEKYDIEYLEITGNLNGDDLALIRDMAGNNINGHLTDGRLATLDLSGASIVDGGTYVQFTEEKYYIDADNYVIVKDTKPYTSQANVFRGFLFAGCGALETITLPNTLLSISNSSTFSDCKKLTTIYIPASVGYMDSGFTNCPSLTSVVIDPNNVKYESPNNNVIIDKETHALITGCKDAVIPTDKGINSISKYAFLGRIGETTMEIPEGITSIGDYAFAQTGITSVVLPSTLVTIDNRAFQGCNQLTEIVIPASVKTIGDNAFSQCSSLKTVTSQIVDPSTVTVGNNAFAYYSIDLIVPVGSVSAYKAAEPWKQFREILDINEMQKSVRTINVEKAGTLSTFISDEDKFVILELTLTGELNGTDFRLLREMAGCGYNGRETNGKLRTLDLSGIRIVADAEDSEGYLNATQVINDSGNYGVNKGEDLPLRTKDDVFGDCLFAGCNRIRSIKFPAGIKEMGHDLFTLAGQGLDIVIPKEVTYIHPNAFNGHPYAKGSFKVEEGNQVYSSPNNCNAIVKGTTLEVGCKNTVIPEGITTIGPGAFDYQRGCPALPESVTRIESRAFYHANASTVTLPKNLQFIGSGAFASFAEPDLKTVYSEIVDPSVVTLEGNPFGTRPIEVLYVPEGTVAAYEAIPSWKNSFSAILEKGTALEQLTLHVETAGTLPTLIPEEKKNHIVQLTLTGNLNGTDFRLIREMAGNDYLGQPTRGLLKKLDISGANIVEGGEKYLDTDRVNSSTGNYTQMGGDFFHFGTQNNVLGNSLFAGCGKLEEIVLPNSITSIGEYVFWYCLNLKALEIPKNVSSIGLNFVYGQNKLSKLTVAEGNMTYSSPANSNALMQGSKLVFGIQNTQIPEGTTVIGANAFASHGPWQVTLPEGVTTIESYAFSQTILGILNMPSTLTTIGPGAFEGCWDQLRSFTLPKSVTSIDGSAFLHCSNLTEMKVEEGNPVYDSRENCNAIIETGSNTLIAGCKNTIIPNSVTTIGQYAFGGIGLTTITIPSSVTSIDHMAFCENTELSDVYCNAESVPNTETDAFSSVQIEQVTLHVPVGCVEAYQAASPWKDFGAIYSSVTSLFDGTNLWTSYVAQENYTIPAGLEAYVISNLSETSAVASQIDYIPQGVPLLLKRNDATTNSFDFATGSGTAPTTNLLKVYDTDKTVSNREGYILYKDEFVLVDEGTLPAGRVFLPLNGGNSANTRGIVIEGEGTTGIQNLVSDSEVSHGVWYDLQGRKIDGKPIKKGVYILNGRKVVVK